MKRLLAVLLLAACGSVKATPDDPDAAPPPDTDPAPDGPAACSPTAAFASQSLVTEASTAEREERAILTGDELEMYITRISGATGVFRLRRSSLTAAWSAPEKVTVFPDDAGAETITADGLTIYLQIAGEIFVASRADTAAEFSAPSALANLNSAGFEVWFSIDPTNTVLHFVSDRDGAAKLFRAARSQASGPFGTPVVVNAPAGAFSPVVSPDGLSLYYGLSTSNGIRPHLTSRSSLTDDFPEGPELSDVTFPQGAWTSWISADHCRAYLIGPAPGGPGDNDVNVLTRA